MGILLAGNLPATYTFRDLRYNMIFHVPLDVASNVDVREKVLLPERISHN